MNDDTIRVRVAMMGPTRVGKTTLLTAILTDARKAFAGTKVSVVAANSETEKRIQHNADELRGTLLAGEFKPGMLRGTQTVQEFQMKVSPGVAGEGVLVEFLDFPGRLLHPTLRNEEQWATVQEFLEESTALLLPVDATVLMETFGPQHLHEVPRILRIGAVEEAIRYWAKYRQDVPTEPALIVFAPVKVESYFADNGGDRDLSAQLLARFREVYADVINAARAELPHVRMAYVPVDSLGCVEVESVEWLTDADPGAPEGAIAPEVTYLVRPGKTREVVGAIDILVPLINQVVTLSRQARQEAAQKATAEAIAAIADRDRRRGFWSRVRDSVNGSKQRREVLAADAGLKAQRELARLQEYDEVLSKLAEQPPGDREKPV